jgi:hypothetical protein
MTVTQDQSRDTILISKALPTESKEVGKDITWLRGPSHDVIMGPHPVMAERGASKYRRFKKVGKGRFQNSDFLSVI